MPKPAQRPVRRHDLGRARGKNDRTKDQNTMLDPSVDVGADMNALNSGKFTRSGEDFTVNGRVYGQHPETGKMFPKSGPGTHQLDRAEHGFLKILNEKGQEYAENFARNKGVSEEKITRVLELWGRCQN